MRAALLLAGVGIALGLAPAVQAKATRAKAPAAPVAAAAAPAEPAPPAPEQVIADLQNRMGQAVAENQRLRAQLADAQATKGKLKEVEAKNERLVAIANELIASYSRRYHSGIKDPFMLGRRKFEAEMQDTASSVYENRADAVAPPATPVDTAAPAPEPKAAPTVEAAPAPQATAPETAAPAPSAVPEPAAPETAAPEPQPAPEPEAAPEAEAPPEVDTAPEMDTAPEADTPPEASEQTAAPSPKMNS